MPDGLSGKVQRDLLSSYHIFRKKGTQCTDFRKIALTTPKLTPLQILASTRYLCDGGGGVLFFVPVQAISLHPCSTWIYQLNTVRSDLAQKKPPQLFPVKGDSEAVFCFFMRGEFFSVL